MITKLGISKKKLNMKLNNKKGRGSPPIAPTSFDFQNTHKLKVGVRDATRSHKILLTLSRKI